MDLLPCPFCGDAGEDYREPSYTKVSHYIYCNGCGCQGPVNYTTDEAAAAWNRRAANAPADPALLALATLGAWVATSHADEPGDIFAPDIEDAEDKFGVIIPTMTAPGQCAVAGQYGGSCPCAEYYHNDEERECRLFAPGIADAIARLLAPDGAASEGVTG